MRREVVVLAMAGLMIGIPGVVGEEEPPDGLEDTLGDLRTGLGVNFIVGCVTYEVGQFTSRDFIHPDLEDLPRPNLQELEYHFEIPMFVSSNPFDYLDGVLHFDYETALPPIEIPEKVHDIEGRAFDILLVVHIGNNYDTHTCEPLMENIPDE